MTRTISILLDLLRFSAALMVVVGHLTQPYFSTGWPDLTIDAVSAVSVFFVLSGFVISFVTETKETNVVDYSTARISRLYSVLVPALVLSGLVLIVAVRFDPQFTAPWSGADSHIAFLRLHPIARFFISGLVSLCFLNSIHNYETCPGVDSPVWSLSFEAAYYAVFAMAFFTRGYKRYLLIGLSCLLFGTPMLRLMPVWFVGVGLHRCIRSMQIGKRRYPIIGIACFVAVILAILSWTRFAAWDHGPHGNFVGQVLHGTGTGRTADAGIFYYWGTVTSMLLLGASQFDRSLGKVLIPIEKPIRWAANHTFALYLFHFPLLVLIYATTHYDRGSSPAKCAVFVAVLGLCGLLSKISEEKKQWWRYMIRYGLTEAVPVVRSVFVAIQWKYCFSV
jgi:peptidoglycan/LPS O-acetylase OafA/YrhL